MSHQDLPEEASPGRGLWTQEMSPGRKTSDLACGSGGQRWVERDRSGGRGPTRVSRRLRSLRTLKGLVL